MFKTSLPDEFHVPDIEINIGSSSSNKELTSVTIDQQLTYSLDP